MHVEFPQDRFHMQFHCAVGDTEVARNHLVALPLGKVAENLQLPRREFGKRTKLLRNTHRFAGFAVLKSPNVPSVLVEIGYMSHPDEERLLNTKKHRRKMTDAMVKAVQRYFDVQQALVQ